ncbi:DUF262 domain-containing protein [Albibacterium indicum]|uniref:DUF262 domain-containing protein n=1 Tax=Albibacterium indicum TaxID=2292082 RepID=UPI000E52844A|nr:DUF262 domain-containing protein [Pedobacter indicus]
MATIEDGDKKYSTLLNEIETGQIKIPQFQRQFVWDLGLSARLIDSILKGYPIGTFIYWRTNERLRSVRNVGNIHLPDPKEGEFVNYVLDGQQRITSLFAALKGEIIERENGKKEDYSNIYIDLTANDDESIAIIDIIGKEENSVIKLTDLLFKKALEIYNYYPEEFHENIDRYKGIIQAYQFKGIDLKDAEIDIATEVFTRLNVGGKDLSLFEIMVAKTYDPSRNFDLYDKFQELLEALEPAKYNTISSANMLQFISLLISKECKRKVILRLDKKEFIDKWDDAVKAIKSAVEFFRSYGIPVSKLLPYNTLIVPFAYFFHHHPNNPTGEKLKLLIDFFWRVSIGFRYSSSVESKLVQDIDKIDKILNEEHPRYEWSVDYSSDFIKEKGYFATGRSFIKAILCLYAKHRPKSFDNHLDVNIDNSWLKIATSKNYHHFFPKSYMRKNQPQWESSQVNHIANITIVDDFLNKNKIRAKAPSDYMKVFQTQNEFLNETMETHMINDLETFGIWDDDYTKFFEKRIEAISVELKRYIIPQRSNEPLEYYEDHEYQEENEL